MDILDKVYYWASPRKILVEVCLITGLISFSAHAQPRALEIYSGNVELHFSGSPNVETREENESPSFLSLSGLLLINFYQSFISPADGARCQMYPTCAAYGFGAVKKHGFFLGGMLTADRLLREVSADSRRYSMVRHYGTPRYLDSVEQNDFWFSRPPNFSRSNLALPGSLEVEKRKWIGKSLDEVCEGAHRSAHAGDWPRAVSKYLRCSFLEPNPARSLIALERAAWQAFNGKDFAQSGRLFSEAIELARLGTAGTLLERVPYLQFGQALSWDMGGFDDEAVHLFSKVARQTQKKSPEFSLAASWAGAWAQFDSLLTEGAAGEGSRYIGDALEGFVEFSNSPGRGNMVLAMGKQAQGSRLPYRSPGVASVFSLVVPGAGLAYAGKPGTGFASFLTNAAFITALVHSVRTENIPLAGILLSFELGWYFGGAQAAGDAAYHYNQDAAGQISRDYRDQYGGRLEGDQFLGNVRWEPLR